MKKLISVLILSSISHLSFGQTSPTILQYNAKQMLYQLTGSTNAASYFAATNPVTLTPYPYNSGNITVQGQSFFFTPAITAYPDTNGNAWIAAAPNSYIVNIQGINQGVEIAVPQISYPTNMAALVIAGTGTYTYTNNANYSVKVDTNDSTPGTLSGKILPGPGVNVTVTNVGQNESLVVWLSGRNTDPFSMPEFMQQQLTFQFQNSASTVFWATNGNDSTVVLGDTNHPAATFTKCLTMLTNGGVIWAQPNQKFTFDTSSYTISQPVTLVGLNSQFGLGGIVTLNVVTNLNMIGGSWDTLVYPQAPLKLRMLYCTLFPDWLAANNQDGIYFIGNQPKPTYAHLDHVKIFSNYDCENQSGFLNSNSVFSASFSWFVASQSPSSPSNPCRSFVAAGTNTSILNDCLFVATGSDAGVGSPPSSFTNVCVSALVGARVFLKNNTYIHGTPNIDSGVSIYLTGGSTVFLQDGMIPSNINSSGNILAPNSTTNSFIYTPLQ